MGDAGIILGKLATGAAQVAVPAALAGHAAKLQESRDKRLHGYRSGELKVGRDFTAAENELNREATSDLAASNREHTAELQEARLSSAEKLHGDTLEFQRDSFDATADERAKRLEVLTSQLADSELGREITQLKVDDARDTQAILDKINDSSEPQEVREAALEHYLLKVPKARKKVIVKQKEGPIGQKLDEYAIFDSASGERMDDTPFGLPQTKQEIRAAFQRGQKGQPGGISGAVAEAMLEDLLRK